MRHEGVPDGYVLVGEPNRWKRIWMWLWRGQAAAAVCCGLAAALFLARQEERGDGRALGWVLVFLAAGLVVSAVVWLIISWACRDNRASIMVDGADHGDLRGDVIADPDPEPELRPGGFDRSLYDRRA